VVTQFSLLRSRLFSCASTAHTTSATRTWASHSALPAPCYTHPLTVFRRVR
jgi:hypothetical protein